LFLRGGSERSQCCASLTNGESGFGACDGIAGIVGDCGGGLTCATCHVMVDEEFLPKTPPMTANEDQMLDFTAMGRQPNSRLSCQLVMQDELEGLTVQIADPQL